MHLAVAIIGLGCFGLAEALVCSSGIRVGGSYAGMIGIAFLGLIVLGCIGRTAKFILEKTFPIQLQCPNCEYDLTLLDGQLKAGDKCPGCDASLA